MTGAAAHTMTSWTRDALVEVRDTADLVAADPETATIDQIKTVAQTLLTLLDRYTAGESTPHSDVPVDTLRRWLSIAHRIQIGHTETFLAIARVVGADTTEPDLSALPVTTTRMNELRGAADTLTRIRDHVTARSRFSDIEAHRSLDEVRDILRGWREPAPLPPLSPSDVPERLDR